MDAVSEEDEEIMMLYLEGEEVSEEMIKRALRKGTIGVRMVPVTCGTSYKNKGVQELLDAIVAYMPSPVDIPAIQGVNPETGEEDHRESDDNAPFSALAFKIATDPYVGKLCFFRVYSGTLNSGSTVLNSTKGTASAWAASCGCTPTTARTSTWSIPAISPPPWVSRTPPPAIPCATWTIPSSSNPWSSPSLLSVWPLSPRPRPARRRWASP